MTVGCNDLTGDAGVGLIEGTYEGGRTGVGEGTMDGFCEGTGWLGEGDGRLEGLGLGSGEGTADVISELGAGVAMAE